jgi:hypothetical protein
MKRLLLTTLVSTAVAMAAAPALGQEPPETRAAPAEKTQRQAARLPSERIEARLTELKTALKITDAQQPQWNAFADTLRKHARAGDERMKARMAQREKGVKRAPVTAIQRLERRQAFLASASTRTEEILATAKPLYAALSAEQQKIADDLIATGGNRRGQHRGMHHRSRS